VTNNKWNDFTIFVIWSHWSLSTLGNRYLRKCDDTVVSSSNGLTREGSASKISSEWGSIQFFPGCGLWVPSACHHVWQQAGHNMAAGLPPSKWYEKAGQSMPQTQATEIGRPKLKVASYHCCSITRSEPWNLAHIQE
jgi:hypothetical protein